MRYWSKHGQIEAIQWKGNNHEEIDSFIGLTTSSQTAKHGYTSGLSILIKTSIKNHVLVAEVSDYIIKDKGGFRVKPEQGFLSEFEPLP